MLKGYPLHSLLADTPARVYYVIELVYEYPVVDIRAKSDCRRTFPSYDFTLIKLRLQIFGRVSILTKLCICFRELAPLPARMLPKATA